MIRVLLALLATLPLPAGAQVPERVVKPEIRKGDSWTYRGMNMLGNGPDTYELRVERADGDTILAVAIRKDDNKEFDGTFTSEWNPVVATSGMIYSPPPRYFMFPMRPGDTRTVEVTRSRPRLNTPSTKYEVVVKVVGWDDVAVPAGRFRAMKIAVDGTFFPPFSRGPINTRAMYWYVPEVRRWVKYHFKSQAIEAEEELLEYKLNED